MDKSTVVTVDPVDTAGRDSHRLRSLNFWKLEIGAAILAILSLGIIVWELTKVNNAPLADWHYHISPNAFLSIFITLAKTGTALCLGSAFAQLCWLFYLSNSQKLTHIDNFASAREGPFGSFLLLFRLQLWGVVPTVARFGAFTALLALAMDPFTQQILGVETRRMVLPGNTTSIPTTRVFSPGISILADNGFQQALFGPLLGIDIPMHFTCASGNCTYPDFVSLGFCSQCTDVTQSAQPQCAVDGYDGRGGCPSIYYDWPAYNTSLTLQNGSLPGNDSSPSDNGANQRPSGIFSLVKSVVSNTRPNGLQNATLFEFVIAQLRTSQSHPNITMQTPPAWNVSACSIRWCGKLYQNMTVTDGILHNITPTEFELKPDPNSNCWQDGTCQAFVPVDSSAVPPQLPRTFTAATNNSFTIKNLLSVDSETPVTNGTIFSSASASIVNSMLWNVDMATSMKRVVKSMTDFSRSVINPEPVLGSSYRYEIYTTVQWGWFALPCAVTLFSIIFMLIVMWMTNNNQSAMWGASSVPLVMSGLGDAHGNPYRRETPRHHSVRAMGVRVQLTRDDHGQFKFRRIGEHAGETEA